MEQHHPDEDGPEALDADHASNAKEVFHGEPEASLVINRVAASKDPSPPQQVLRDQCWAAQPTLSSKSSSRLETPFQYSSSNSSSRLEASEELYYSDRSSVSGTVKSNLDAASIALSLDTVKMTGPAAGLEEEIFELNEVMYEYVHYAEEDIHNHAPRSPQAIRPLGWKDVGDMYGRGQIAESAGDLKLQTKGVQRESRTS